MAVRLKMDNVPYLLCPQMRRLCLYSSSSELCACISLKHTHPSSMQVLDLKGYLFLVRRRLHLLKGGGCPHILPPPPS